MPRKEFDEADLVALTFAVVVHQRLESSGHLAQGPGRDLSAEGNGCVTGGPAAVEVLGVRSYDA